MENEEKVVDTEEESNQEETKNNTEEELQKNEEDQKVTSTKNFSKPADLVLLEALIKTNMEKDKTLFLAAIGISGFLISFLSSPTTASILKVLCGITLLCFTIVIISIIVVFQLNGSYIKTFLARQSSQIIQHWLGILDKVSMIFFIIGILISVGMGIHVVSF